MSLIAGLDIGSTSVKMSLFDTNTKTVVSTNSSVFKFKINESLRDYPNYYQLNVGTICETIQKLLSEFDLNLRKSVKMIVFCGQMHGCVLWDNNSFYNYDNTSKTFEITDDMHISDVYNWQDKRCTNQFIADLPIPDSYGDQISTGFGCATIYWLQRHSREFLSTFNSAGTIMDFIVAIICGLKRPVMSNQNAMSWGYFDPIVNSWNHNILKSNGFPIHLLPIVQKPDSLAGQTKFNWLGIEPNTPVLVALGDMQCATYACLRDYSKTAVLSVSTSMQMSVLMDTDFNPEKKSQSNNKCIDYYPYFNNRYLSVAASLNGGNVLQSLIKTLKNMIESIADIEISDQQIWEKIYETYEKNITNPNSNGIIVKPTMFGERHDPNLKASIINISNAFELNELICGYCKGLMDNIFNMMSTVYLKTVGVQKMIGTGGAMLRNPILKKELERKLNMSLIYIEGNDADVGAVWFAYNNHYK